MGNAPKKSRISIFIRSFRLRIFLIISLLSVAICLVLRAVVLQGFYERNVQTQSDKALTQLQSIANQMVTCNYLQDCSSVEINARLNQLSNLYDGRILVTNSNFQIVYDSYNICENEYAVTQEILKAYDQDEVTSLKKEKNLLTVAVPITQPKDGMACGAISLDISLASLNAAYIHFNYWLWIWLVIILLIVFGIAFALSMVLVKPFERMAKSINSVASFDDETELVSDYLETEEIADAFNQMRTRLKVLDDSRQEFVSNVSHELKTPLTSMKVLADSLNVQEGAPIEMYQDFMQDISAEIDRENQIITDLLSLVKMDRSDAGLNLKPNNINAMLESILKRLGPIARKNDVDLILESQREVTADVDLMKFDSAIANLVENAIKYNKHPGWVKVVLDADHQNVTIAVTDCGIGIPEDSVNHIFERFYRVDKSHSKEISGTGLGLAITRKIILLHRGTIQVRSVVDEGTTFLVTIPRSYKAQNGADSDFATIGTED